VTLELPRWLLAERLTLGLIVAAAAVLEAAIARYPGLPQGPGLVLGGILAAWQWYGRRHRPRVLALGPDGSVSLAAGREPPVAATGPRARVVGRAVVLHWRAGGRSRTAWLTAADLPRDALRRARVCCRTHRRATLP
jgi:hypothetical protein